MKGTIDKKKDDSAIASTKWAVDGELRDIIEKIPAGQHIKIKVQDEHLPIEFLQLRNSAYNMEERRATSDTEYYSTGSEYNTSDFSTLDRLREFQRKIEEARERNTFEIWKELDKDGSVDVNIKFDSCVNTSSCSLAHQYMSCEIIGEAELV